MQYELYIDVLFLVNFMMDYLLLLAVRRILKCSATHGRICIGSLTGSLLTCLTVALPFSGGFVKLILFHPVISLLMLKTGLETRTVQEMLRALAALYTGGFLLGGIFTWLHQYVRGGSLFFFLAVLSYQLVQWVWSFITRLQRYTGCRCSVTLYLGGKEHTVKALIDTGNSLRDPVTDCPVCIIDIKEIKKLTDEYALSGLRKIMFHSIGKEQGDIPVIELEKMCIHKEKECWVYHPVIGICGERITAGGEYGMILNPDISDLG